MSYRLFLDDERFPRQVSWVWLPTHHDPDWVIVRNYNDFVDCITKNGLPEFIAFDHDLALEHYKHVDASRPPQYDAYAEKTGYDAAKWLKRYCEAAARPIPPYVVHSMNPVGRENIKNLLG